MLEACKRIAEKFVKSCFKLVSLVFNYRVLKGWKCAKDRVRMEGIKRRLASCGERFWVDSPSEWKGLSYISIGDDFHCRSRLRMEAVDDYLGDRFHPGIKIGNRVRINNDCHIGIIHGLEIEDDVVIASRVYISDHSHGQTNGEGLEKPVAQRPLYSKGPVHICQNAWIGEGACILPGVTVGKGSIIGANAVVTKSVPEYSIAAGCPAKVIRKLDAPLSGPDHKKIERNYDGTWVKN